MRGFSLRLSQSTGWLARVHARPVKPNVYVETWRKAQSVRRILEEFGYDKRLYISFLFLINS